MYWNHKRRSKVKVVNVHPKLLVPVVDVSCFIQSNRVKSTEENQKYPVYPRRTQGQFLTLYDYSESDFPTIK